MISRWRTPGTSQRPTLMSGRKGSPLRPGSYVWPMGRHDYGGTDCGADETAATIFQRWRRHWRQHQGRPNLCRPRPRPGRPVLLLRVAIFAFPPSRRGSRMAHGWSWRGVCCASCPHRTTKPMSPPCRMPAGPTRKRPGSSLLDNRGRSPVARLTVFSSHIPRGETYRPAADSCLSRMQKPNEIGASLGPRHAFQNKPFSIKSIAGLY
jgi:hypothetical protein